MIYDLRKLKRLEQELTSKETGVEAVGPSGKNCILDLKFTID